MLRTSCVARHAPARDRRAAILEVFGELADINLALGLGFKAKAYKSAIATLERVAPGKAPPVVATPADAAKVLGGVGGVGPKLVAKAVEVVETGALQELEELRKHPQIATLRAITQIHGFGPVGARKLIEVSKVSTVAELQRLVNKGVIKLTPTQQIGIKYVNDFQKKIPLAEAKKHEKLLQVAVSSIDPRLQLCVCGSFRRQRPHCSDIDALITLGAAPRRAAGAVSSKRPQAGAKNGIDGANAMRQIVDDLQQRRYVVDVLGSGPTKFMGVARLPEPRAHRTIHRRVDIRWVEPAAFPSAMLYFTGSKLFNTRMRSLALSKGFTLNEYGLYKLKGDGSRGARVFVASEEEIFDAIGMPFVKPVDRDA